MPIGFRDLVETVKALDPTLSYLTPAQTVCNYVVALLPQRRQPPAATATRTAPGCGSW